MPMPQNYEPSRWNQRLIIALIASVAFIIATYMGLYQWRLISHVWDPVFDGETMKVLDSDVSHDITKLIKIPDAILGSIAYLGDIIFGLCGSTKRWFDRPWLVVLFGIDVIPLGVVSAILVFLQGTVVGSWCFPCLMTASISVILIFLAYDEVCATLVFLHRVWKRSKSFSVLWDTFWGKAHPIAHAVAVEIIEKGRKNVG